MKKLSIILGAAALLSSGIACADNLTLISQNISNPIDVKCGASPSSERETNLPIPKNGNQSLPYFLIDALFGSPVYCDFYDGTNDIGEAELTVGTLYQTAEINTATFDSTKYTVHIKSGSHDPLPLNTWAHDITVTLAEK